MIRRSRASYSFRSSFSRSWVFLPNHGFIGFVTSHFAGANRRKHHHIECLFPTTLGSCGDTTIVVSRELLRPDADHLDMPPSTNSLMPAADSSCCHPLQERDVLRDFISATHARHWKGGNQSRLNFLLLRPRVSSSASCLTHLISFDVFPPALGLVRSSPTYVNLIWFW